MSIKVDRRAFLSTGALALAQLAVGRIQSVSGAENKTSPPKYQISEVITGNRIEPRFAVYYKIQTNTPGWLYIAQSKESTGQNIFSLAYNPEDKRQGRLFPAPDNRSKPVAIVDGKGGALDNVFEIYDRGNSYSVNYKFSPLLYIPRHTEVGSSYMLNVDSALQKIPKGLVDALNEQGRRLMIAKNIEDSYYWLYPGWKEEDENCAIDPSIPWIQKINGNWVDNRRHSNVPGYYFSDRSMIVMPQQYVRYGTTDIIDRSEHREEIRSTVSHEIGHGLDYINSARYSDAQAFVTAYNKDMEKIPQEEQERVGYFLMNRREPFAEVTAALLGGLTSNRAARILNYFPDSAEHIRTNILPEYGYEISIEEIRENIYPNYRPDDKTATKVAFRDDFNNARLLEEDVVLCC